MSDQPWMKFYPADWRADPALRTCGLAARGLWVEMLALMHEAAPRGHLLVNGKQVSNRQLAVLAGCTEGEVDIAMTELAEAGVFSVKKNGVVFSRRMEKDDNRARKLRENGKLGGNPSLRKQTTIEALDNQPDNTQKLEARSQSPEEVADATSEKRGRAIAAKEFAEEFWPSYPNKVGKPDAQKKFEAARRVADLETIMAGLRRYVAGKPGDRQWLNPATWLYQQRWTDEPASPVVVGTIRGGDPPRRQLTQGERIQLKLAGKYDENLQQPDEIRTVDADFRRAGSR